MDEEHSLWLRRNHDHLAECLPARAILDELASNYVFLAGSEEYLRVASHRDGGRLACRSLLAELSAKSANAFLYFIRAVNKICPEVLMGCEPVVETQRYLVSVMSDADRLSLTLAVHWRALLSASRKEANEAMS